MHTKCIKPLPAARDVDARDEDIYHNKVPLNIRQPIEENVGPYFRAVGDWKSVRNSVAKLDFERCTLYKSHKHWKLAKTCVQAKWDSLFRNSYVWGYERIHESIDVDTSPGVLWTLLGYKTKGEVLSDTIASDIIMSLFAQPNFEKYPPVWRLVDKLEWYHIDDLLADKVRTFIIPPLELLFYCKMIHGQQNELMKDFWWSAYGFNPYQGGVDRLARELMKFDIIVTYDVKGWDRLLPLMDLIHDLRNAHVQEKYLYIAHWVSQNTCSSYILLPDGRIVKKDIGNNSGSGTTTNDNIIGHSFIIFFALVRLYKGDYDLAYQCLCKLFGDDNVCGLYKPKGMDYDRVERSIRKTFKMFGYELDPFRISPSLEGAEFLGFQFTKGYKGFWLPKYNLGRISASIVYTIEKQAAAACVSRVWSLCIMTAGHGEEIYNTYAEYLKWYLSIHCDDSDPIIQSFVQHGAPSYEEVMDFYLGTESGTKVAGGFKSVGSCLEVKTLSS